MYENGRKRQKNNNYVVALMEKQSRVGEFIIKKLIIIIFLKNYMQNLLLNIRKRQKENMYIIYIDSKSR